MMLLLVAWIDLQILLELISENLARFCVKVAEAHIFESQGAVVLLCVSDELFQDLEKDLRA